MLIALGGLNLLSKMSRVITKRSTTTNMFINVTLTALGLGNADHLTLSASPWNVELKTV